MSRIAILVAILAALPFGHSSRADTPVLPQGGTVVVGAATIKSNIPGSLDVTTATDRTAINWQSFSIGAGNTVTIKQPNASSLTLNQVVGADPSSIFGSLKSNGQVVLANPNGIWFGPGSHVDVASIVASTATASQAALNAFASGGTLMLDQAGNPNASVVNDGSISIGDEGLAGLVAPGVANNGVIAARLGRVVLASGTVATLDFYGDGLISFAVGGSVTAVAKDQAGSPLSAAVVNAGTITNPGGTVLLTAAAAKAVVDDTINMSGVIVASAVNTAGGEIDLDGGTGAVTVSGTLEAAALHLARSLATVTPTAIMKVGSFSADVSSSLTLSYQSLQSDGDVATFATSIGGRIVANTGTITNSSATGTVSGGGGIVAVGGLVGTNAGSVITTSVTGIVSGGGVEAVGGLTGSNSGGPAIVQGTTLTAQSNDVVAQNPIPPVPLQPSATALVTSSPAPGAPPAARRPKPAIILPDSVLHPVVTVPTIALSLPQSSPGSDSIAAIETSLSGIGKLPPGN